MKAIAALFAGIAIGWTGAVFVGAYRFSHRYWPERELYGYRVDYTEVYV